MNKRLGGKILAAVLVVAICWEGSRIFRARSKVVTLKVQDADVREVVDKVERQTRETIPVHKEVTGKISLDVVDAPLPDVLSLVAEQAHARSQVVQPLYSSKSSLDGFLRAIRGEAEPSQVGWTNLAQVIRPPLMAPPRQVPTPEQPITLLLTNRNLRLAELVFARLAQVQVVAENGTPDKISLNLYDASR